MENEVKNGRYVDALGTVRWYKDGQLHREDGPSVEWNDGSKSWYLNGTLHREDGPAVEDANGHKEWFKNGQKHREDGPAIEWEDGHKEWWINGVQYSEEHFNKYQLNKKLEHTLEEKPLGKKVKI